MSSKTTGPVVGGVVGVKMPRLAVYKINPMPLLVNTLMPLL